MAESKQRPIHVTTTPRTRLRLICGSTTAYHSPTNIRTATDGSMPLVHPCPHPAPSMRNGGEW